MKHLFTLLFCLSTIVLAGQNITNGDFENWTDYGTYKIPVGWKTNTSATISFGETVYDTSDAQSGDSAAVVQTILVSGTSNFYGGILTNGRIRNDSLGLDGPAISYRPESFSGFYKYDAAPGDMALVVLYMYRFDVATNRDSLIASGNARLGPAATYQQFGFQILNTDSLETSLPKPDSYVILITSTDSLDSPQPSKLTIDNLSFEGIVSTPVLTDLSDVSIYPNPVDDHFVVNSPKHSISSVVISNAEGRQVLMVEAAPGANELLVNTNRLSTGFYYAQLQFDNGAVETRFITIVK
jgi:hypothetical protein